VRDGADWTSSGRLFQSRGPAAAKERSPTVTRRDGRTKESYITALLYRSPWADVEKTGGRRAQKRERAHIFDHAHAHAPEAIGTQKDYVCLLFSNWYSSSFARRSYRVDV